MRHFSLKHSFLRDVLENIDFICLLRQYRTLPLFSRVYLANSTTLILFCSVYICKYYSFLNNFFLPISARKSLIYLSISNKFIYSGKRRSKILPHLHILQVFCKNYVAAGCSATLVLKKLGLKRRFIQLRTLLRTSSQIWCSSGMVTDKLSQKIKTYHFCNPMKFTFCDLL